MNTHGHTRSVSALVDYVRLPDEIRPGVFDGNGDPSQDGRTFISVAGTAFIWGLFGTRLAPGQRGELVFTNIAGSFLAGTSFTEWNESTREPFIGDALLTLIASQRGDGTIRIIGRNTSNKSVLAAAGIVVGDRAPY